MIQRAACLIAREEDLPRCQAMELHMMDTLPAGTAMLLMYSVKKAVSQGFLEDTAEAVRADTLAQEGGVLSRRLSGGGSRYLDAGTLCYCLALPRGDFSAARTQAVTGTAAAMLGVSCAPGARGTLCADGRVIGEASFLKRGAAAAQQGVLYADTDPGQAAVYLQSGLPIAPLSAFRPGLTLTDAQQAMSEAMGRVFGAEPVWLDERMMDAGCVEDGARAFRRPDFITRAEAGGTLRVAERFPWCRAAISLQVENSVIARADITTDALETALITALARSLEGCPFLIGAIDKRFSQILQGVRDPRLAQVAGDLSTLLRGHLRQSHREGGDGTNL